MRVTIPAIAAIGLLSLVTACETSGEATSPPPSSEPPATSTEQVTSSQPAAGGGCPAGDWEVTTMRGKSGADVDGVPIVATSGGGFTLSMTEAGTWVLAGENATVALSAADLSVNATVDGTAEGDYAQTGDTYTFRQRSASGQVTLDSAVAGVSSWSMDEVGPALAPSGEATLACGDGTLTISSESVELDLRAVGAQTSEAPDTSAPSGGGGTMTINESGLTRTVDCAGQGVVISGSANDLTFTGTCASVTVNGARNEVRIAQVGQIAVNGTFNTVTWSAGDPKTSNNGQGNTISQG